MFTYSKYVKPILKAIVGYLTKMPLLVNWKLQSLKVNTQLQTILTARWFL